MTKLPLEERLQRGDAGDRADALGAVTGCAELAALNVGDGPGGVSLLRQPALTPTTSSSARRAGIR
jgi:hypothetical protein